MSVYQAELPAHFSAVSVVVGLNLVGGPPPGRSHLVGWFEPGLQAPMAKAFLSTFQACTLPSYVTAATKNRAFVEEYVSFQDRRSSKRSFHASSWCRSFRDLFCYTNSSIYLEPMMSFFNEHARRDELSRLVCLESELGSCPNSCKSAMKSHRV